MEETEGQEANNEHRERHLHVLRHSWRHRGSQGTDTNSQIQMCNYGDANTRGQSVHTPQASTVRANDPFTLNKWKFCHG